jgi:hypothetical protein
MAEIQLQDIIKPENKVYGKSKIMTDTHALLLWLQPWCGSQTDCRSD